MNARHHAQPGSQADAKVKTVAGVIGHTDYHQFAWAWAAGDGNVAYIGYGTMQYELHGAGAGETGVETHRAPYRPPTPNP